MRPNALQYIFLCLVLQPFVSNAQQVFKRQAAGYDPNRQRDFPCEIRTANMPDWCHFETHVTVRTLFGDVRGFNIPWHNDDTIYNPAYQDKPANITRRINCFLGVPYAAPPVGELRFQRPEDPSWGGMYKDATAYRPACPQKPDRIRREIPNFPQANISEDCLYLNIFAPNYTKYNDHFEYYNRQLWPVLVWFNSGTFEQGAAQMHPGHVLATQNIVVVTINYRLGALGFLSTQDEECSGNWGLFDQQKALEFVKLNIKSFRGDPDRVTIAGDGAGAASVGFHLLSDMTRGKGFFHRCIMMSGTDLSYNKFLNPYYSPRSYALELARLLGCVTNDTYKTIRCLRKIRWERIVDIQDAIVPRNGEMGVVWAPTQDGGWFMENPLFPRVPYLRYHPRDMRMMGLFDRLPCIIGLNTQDGVETAMKLMPNLERGLLLREQQDIIEDLLTEWEIIEPWKERAQQAIEFQYTHWPDPENNTARGQQYIHYVTDLEVGIGMDQVLKEQSQYEAQWMYQFNYNSWNNWLPEYQGVGFSQSVPYVFGVPFMNETVLNQSHIIAHQHYDHEDRNMSEWMMYMWVNFVAEGTPAPNMTRNVTWDPFNMNNFSYLVIDHHSYIWFRYRQEKYGFWREYFPDIAKQEFYFATPTPAGYEYVLATGGMSAVVVVLWCGVACLAILLWARSQKDRYMQEYPKFEVPASFAKSTHSLHDYDASFHEHSTSHNTSRYRDDTQSYRSRANLPSVSSAHPRHDSYTSSRIPMETLPQRGNINPAHSGSGSSNDSPPYRPEYRYTPVTRSGYVGHSVC